MYIFEYEIPSKSRFIKPVFVIRQVKGEYEIGWRFNKQFERSVDASWSSKQQVYYEAVKYLTKLEEDIKFQLSGIKKELISKGLKGE